MQHSFLATAVQITARTMLPPARLMLTLFTGFGVVDREISAIEVFLVEGGNRLAPPARHFHKAEAAQPPSFAIGDQFNGLHRPIGTEQVTNAFLSRAEWEITDINVRGHTGLLCASPHMACVTI
jgi:hypothetical protein